MSKSGDTAAFDADQAFDDMADACIAAAEAVLENGTPEMQAAIRALLYDLGREIVRRGAVRRGEMAPTM